MKDDKVKLPQLPPIAMCVTCKGVYEGFGWVIQQNSLSKPKVKKDEEVEVS